MKKHKILSIITSIALGATLVFSLASCANDSTSTSSETVSLSPTLSEIQKAEQEALLSSQIADGTVVTTGEGNQILDANSDNIKPIILPPGATAENGYSTKIITTAPVSKTNKDLGFQLNGPETGDEIAVLDTTFGTIKIRLFRDEAPKAVENFVTLANQGFYDGTTFHRVINDFMIQAGINREGNTESIYGGMFEDEFTSNLINLRGAVSCANIGLSNTNGTQFFINQKRASAFEGFDYYDYAYSLFAQNSEAFIENYGLSAVFNMPYVTNVMRELYKNNGGNFFLDGAYHMDNTGHTVFGQVFEGMSIVDAIAAADTDDNDMPVEDIIVKKITITQY